MTHTIVYTENAHAGIVCRNVNIDDPQVIPANKIRYCQHCGAGIELEWNVRILEI